MKTIIIDKRVGIIGCGNMGEILLKGLFKKISDRKNILVGEKNEERLNYLKKKYEKKALFTPYNHSVVKNSQVIIIAVKPQEVESLLKDISGFIKASHLIISIVAGIPISFIKKNIPKSGAIIRVMPNLPALIGEGMSVYSPSRGAKEEDKKIVEEIFEGVGKVLQLNEDTMDAVTALSGSGPAYVFYMIEGMIEGGCKLGFTEEQAKILSVQTLIGAAKMIQKGGDYRSLRKKVTSPGGTTEAALKVLIEKKWKEFLIEAIKRAYERSKELP